MKNFYSNYIFFIYDGFSSNPMRNMKKKKIVENIYNIIKPELHLKFDLMNKAM